MVRKASVSSAMSASSNALRRSGRLRVSVAMPRASVEREMLLLNADSWMRTTILSSRQPSHPKNAELGLGDRGVEAGGQRERQDAARVGGVDDAVVPEARAGVIGMALRLVLRADGGFE